MNPKIISILTTLYQAIDTSVQRLNQVHAERIHCSAGCADCCVDDITVYSIEAAFIQYHAGAQLKTAVAYPTGACVFLNSKHHCRIYPWRPYVCRTQGMPLHWIEETLDDAPVAYRDICPLNEPGPAVETLPESACWKIGPVETTLAQLQYTYGNKKMTRIALRSLCTI